MTTTLNVPKLYRLKEFLENHRDAHDQDSWISTREGNYESGDVMDPKGFKKFFKDLIEDPENPACGTTACAAGWAMLLDARVFYSDDQVIALDEEISDEPPALGEYVFTHKAGEKDPKYIRGYAKDGKYTVVHVPDAARRALGLNPRQANTLFYGLSTTDEVLGYLSALIDVATTSVED